MKNKFWVGTGLCIFAIVLLQVTLTYLGQRDDVDFLPKCARTQDPSYMRENLKRGSNPNTCDTQGNSLLMIAAEQGNEQVIAVLLAYGADVRYRSSDGRTVFDVIAKNEKFGNQEQQMKARYIARLLEGSVTAKRFHMVD